MFALKILPKRISIPAAPSHQFSSDKGVTKRCRLSLLTNSALLYECKSEGIGGVAGSQPIRTAVHITWHEDLINFGDLPPHFNLCFRYRALKVSRHPETSEWGLKEYICKGPSLVGFLGSSCHYKRFLSCLGCFLSAQYRIFFSSPDFISIHLSPVPSKPNQHKPKNKLANCQIFKSSETTQKVVFAPTFFLTFRYMYCSAPGIPCTEENELLGN